MAGTLSAPVLSRRFVARVQRDQFERQQQVEERRWTREREVAELDRRRGCYISVNAAFRQYRTHLMNFLWLVHKDEVTPEAREVVEEARHVQHAAFAEAQMIASPAVLVELDGMMMALSESYRRTMCLEEGNPDQDGSFDDIRMDIRQPWRRWEGMRDVMRSDLGVGEPS
ncbi:hypothetical protein ACWEQ8_43365 [Streptomyces noursei]